MPAATDQPSALVFNITRGSFVDGWGIRTTIFLKGCPLRCRWCCNPESQNTQPELAVIPEDCTQCGLCRDFCGALKLTDAGPVVDRAKCVGCGKCAERCVTNALSMYGKPYTVDEAFETLVRDRDYFERSGGGVTIGGGEATLNADFTYALLKKLQGAGIHVAIDTCGYMTSEKSLRILEEADLILFDLKGMESEAHRRNTGADNAPIHETLLRLGALGKDIIIRLPLIPGANDDEATVRAEAALIAKAGSVKRIDVIPYHDFGRVKYERLGRPYPAEGTPMLSEEDQQRVVEILQTTGIPVQIGG